VIGVLAAWWMKHRGAPATGPISEVAVAVLPFQNLGSDHSTDFLRLALPDEISTTLSYVPALAIRPSASTLKYAKEEVEPQAAGRELQVADVITGHYQQEGDRLRVTLEAIQVESNRVLWQESLSVAAQDVIELQDQVSARVRQGLVPVLGAGLAPAESGSRPRNPEAFNLYLRSLAVSSDVIPNREAIAMLERSVGLDPSYAPAWNQLGHRYYYDGEYGDGGEAALARSKAAYERAISLDPNLLEASAQLIERKAEDGELDAAVDEAESLVQRRPDSAAARLALAYVLRYGGALEESARECDTAFGLDRSNLLRSCALTFELMKNYDRAREYARLDAGSQWSRRTMADLLLREKKYEEAMQQTKQFVPGALISPLLLEACIEHRPSSREIEEMARTGEAQTMAVRDVEPKYFMATYFALCGQRDAALRMLRTAVDHNYCSYPAIDNDPMVDSIRNTPEFARIRADAIECNQKFMARLAQRPQ
jgi:TolB-like protein/lipoprotein NlpI